MSNRRTDHAAYMANGGGISSFSVDGWRVVAAAVCVALLLPATLFVLARGGAADRLRAAASRAAVELSVALLIISPCLRMGTTQRGLVALVAELQ